MITDSEKASELLDLVLKIRKSKDIKEIKEIHELIDITLASINEKEKSPGGWYREKMK